jgi:hypothetical protein
MKRIAAAAAIVAAIALGASAQSTSKPNRVYPDAKVALILPDDTETSVDSGTWMAISESTGTSVMFEKYDDTFSPGEINRSVIAKAAAAYGVKGFKFVALGNPRGLAFGYGKGKYTSEDGTTMDGFFGLLDNTAMKDRTFFFGFLVPSLDDPDIYDGIKAAVDDMAVAK